MVHLFIHLLLKANHEPGRWQGIEIKRGQLVTGRKQLSKETGISERSIRTCINRLKSTSELTSKTTNRFSIITLCNYDSYQAVDYINDQQNDQPTANKRPASDQQPTTNKNNKEEKELKEDKIGERIQNFEFEVLRNSNGNYPASMIEAFLAYWTEPSNNGKKFRRELERTWDTSRRLVTWAKNQKRFESSKKRDIEHSTDF